MTSKASILQDILKIDEEIDRIRRDSTYRKIKRNLMRLEGRSFRAPIVTTDNPDDLDETIRMRRNSKEMKETLRRYRERRLEFEERINQLLRRKKNLEEQLFG